MAWIDAEDPASFASGVAGAPGLADPTGGDRGRAVRHWLEAGGKGCLVVFHHAADPDTLRPDLPVAGAARMLVTSNR